MCTGIIRGLVPAQSGEGTESLYRQPPGYASLLYLRSSGVTFQLVIPMPVRPWKGVSSVLHTRTLRDSQQNLNGKGEESTWFRPYGATFPGGLLSPAAVLSMPALF